MTVELTTDQKITLLKDIKNGHKYLSLASSPVWAIEVGLQWDKEGLVKATSSKVIHGWEIYLTEKGERLLAELEAGKTLEP